MLWLLRRSQLDWQQRLVRLIWSSAWLLLWARPALDGQFHWSHGAFYFLILAGWPQLYTHKWLWTWLKNSLQSISNLFHLLSLPCQGPMQGALCVAAWSLKRECWEFCVNSNIDQRQRSESWELQTIFLALFTTSESQLLTFYMGYALPLPAHTHSPQTLRSPFPGLLKQ